MAKFCIRFALLALFCTNGFVHAAVPPEVDKYLRRCEQHRIKEIFALRESLAELQRKFDSMERPETTEETRVRDALLGDIDGIKSQLKLVEDFSKQVHPHADISSTTPLLNSRVSTGRLFFRTHRAARRFVVVHVVNANHLIVESYFDHRDSAPEKAGPNIVIQMATAKIKVGDSVEPDGAWNVVKVVNPIDKKGHILGATPLDLRPYERHAAAIRKASLAEFHKREKEWLEKQQRLQDAADADPQE